MKIDLDKRYICNYSVRHPARRGYAHSSVSTHYIESVPGDGGVDWGWGGVLEAKPISGYWARRFRADMERVGPHRIVNIQAFKQVG